MTAVRFSNGLSPKGIDLERQTGDRVSDEADVLPGAFVQHDSVPATLRQVFTKRSDLLVQPVTKRSDLLVQPVAKRDNLGAQRRIQAVDAFTDPLECRDRLNVHATTHPSIVERSPGVAVRFLCNLHIRNELAGSSNSSSLGWDRREPNALQSRHHCDRAVVR